jgi:glycosyltransferase involved in cell wall biosynthesis
VSEISHNPLVTFIVLTFNQEAYVREAIAAAFAQEYEPMEIVISDDCSTDRTFEIVEEMAREYRGSKLIRTVRNPQNMGIFPHVLARGLEAAGDIVFLAGGDDISLPERTARTVAAFEPDVACVFSRVSTIGPQGQVISPVEENLTGLGNVTPFVWNGDRSIGVIQGCSAAYRKWVFNLPIKPSNDAYPEDYFFTNYLALAGAGIIRLEDVLVLYRSHSSSLTNAGRYTNVDAVFEESTIYRSARSRLDMIADMTEMAKKFGASDKLNKEFIEESRFAATNRAEWPELSFWERSRRTLSLIPRGFDRGFEQTPGGLDASNWGMFVWCASRLWGRYPRYQPKSYLARFQKKYQTRP